MANKYKKKFLTSLIIKNIKQVCSFLIKLSDAELFLCQTS